MSGDSPAPRAGARPWHYVVTLVLVGLAVHLLLPQVATLEHSLQTIRSMAWWAVALAAVAQMFSYLGSGVLLSAIAGTVGERLSVLQGTLITTASYSVGLVAGGMVGGGAATYRWVRGSGVGAAGALLAGWLPGLMYDGVLVFVSIFGLLYLLVVHDLTTLQAVSFGLIVLILALLVAAVIWGSRHRLELSRLAGRVLARWASLRRRGYDQASTEAAVNRLFSGWDALGGGNWHGPALGAALNTIFDMLTLYLLFVAAGHPVSPAVLLAGYGLPLLLGKAPLLPGGVGIVESTMAALYIGLGVPKAVAVVVILVYRLLSFWLPILVGFPLVPVLEQKASTNAPGTSPQ